MQRLGRTPLCLLGESGSNLRLLNKVHSQEQRWLCLKTVLDVVILEALVIGFSLLCLKPNHAES